MSTDPPDDLAKAKSATKASFPFVSDSGGELIDLFNTRHADGHPAGKGDIARSASILLDQDGKILWSHYAENYRVRPTPDAILTALPTR